MGQTFLTPAQKTVLAAVAAEPKLADFYLTGGTALAVYYLQHRISDDLDFFTAADIEPIFLRGFVGKLKAVIGVKTLRFEHIFDRYQFFFKLTNTDTELKIEFAKYPFHQLEPPTAKDGIKIDSFRDIAANKLMALLDRFDPKDFVDLYFILPQIPLERIRADIERKFGVEVGPIFLGGELAKVRRITALPKTIKPLTLEQLKQFFVVQARRINL